MNPFPHLFDFERDETEGERVFFRIFELVVCGLALQWAWYWAASIDGMHDIVQPQGLAYYIDVSFMFDYGFAYANATVITGLMVAAFLRLWRGSYLAVLGLFHLQYVARYCLGKVPHGSNLVGMAVLGLGVAVLVFRQRAYVRRFALGFMYFFVGLGYSMAGICKLVGTGVTWSDGRHLWMWISEKGVDAFAKTGVLEFNALQQLVLDHYEVATAFLTVGLVSELAAFLIWWRPFRLPVGLALLGLHLGIYATMNILFAHSMLLLVLLAFPWARLIDAGLRRLAPQHTLRRRLTSFARSGE
jgi:hypothetical protein